MESALQLWQLHYCSARYELCERYRRISKGRDVPPDLLPNGKTLGRSADS
jgi:hypothetical protein